MNRIFERIDRRRGWTAEETLLLDQVRRLCVEQIAPRAADLDRTGEFPWDNIRRINELGLNRIFLPEAHGGVGLRFRTYLEVVKIIAEACASTGIIYATNYHAIGPLMDFGSEDLKARILPQVAEGTLGALAITEAVGGSDATAMTTRFRPEGDEIVVDGGKVFITSGDVADVLLLFGKWDGIADPKGSISLLVMEPKATQGFKVLRLEKKLGHRASSTAALAFEGCRVPRANLIGAPGDGLKLLFAALNRSRPSVAAHALGIARAAFRDMVAYANDRRSSGRRIVDFQASQFTIADAATDLAMAEAWLDYLCGVMEDGEEGFGLEASMAKMRASDLAMRIATDAIQMHGGYGYIQDYRVERLFRDAKITQIWEGTNQVHRQLIGRSFARRD